jgi:hypothetical protein
MTRMPLIQLADTLYPPAVRAQAIRAFGELCTFDTTLAIDGVSLYITPRPDAPAEIIDEFLSYLLTGSLETHLTQSDV